MINIVLATGPNIDVADKLVPNLWNFLMQFCAFLVLVVCVIFFAYKPIAKYIKKRNDYINSKLNDSLEREKETFSLNKEAEEKLRTSRKEAIDIVEKAKLDAQLIRDDENKKLKDELKEKRIAFDKELAYEKKQAIVESTKEITNLAIDISSQILQRNVNKDDEDKLVDTFINEMDKE